MGRYSEYDSVLLFELIFKHDSIILYDLVPLVILITISWTDYHYFD